ncbi:RHS domain-containing protein [Veillonella rogosae]|uniref:RHS domain-containing protein n=1 Tax=Veillonella rogosae TaxID=423477 RepID=UPI003B6815C4
MASCSPYETSNPDVEHCGTHEGGFACLNHINEDGESRQQTYYFHCDQIGIPREMTDDEGKLVSFLQKKMKILVVFS